MKKTMMITAALLMGSAANAQTWNMGTSQPWSPSPSAMEYPPCERGDDADKCIQLYERGVRTSDNMAMNRNHGMTTIDTAMNDGAAGTMPVGTVTDQDPADLAAQSQMAGDDNSGQGGPYEPVDGSGMAGWPEQTSRSGYPPCARSDSADSCIQLYERGVSGEGN